MQRVAGPDRLQGRAPAPATASALVSGPARGWISRWIRPLEPKASILLGMRPVESVGREVKDALLEYTDSQQAAAFFFGSRPASMLSQEWRVVVVLEDTAHCFEINGGAILIPTKPQSWRALRRQDLAWRYPRIGYTVDSIEEITIKAVRISWPMKQSLYSENCQKFAYLLFQAIRQPTQPPTVSDVLSGLDQIPGPFRTLNHRCQAVVLTTLASWQKQAQAAANRMIGAPLTKVVGYGVCARNIFLSCFVLVRLVVQVYMQVIFTVFVLAYDKDLLKASRELRIMADDVRRFNGDK
ncbi:hypothetical protein BP6252_02929 [Coleophoma cylindrospora]|uniref:Uncharacterized protein n=1 Tax=Coleophoma cylindrospora TaxID=1849047 RepID=A0A3D8S674_9HELO|nr:hypothetical protein BP6252_02929 [Coleophoma cylindrospora]